MQRLLRLTALGSAIGLVAGVLILAAGALLLGSIAALWEIGAASADGTFVTVPTGWRATVAGFALAMIAAGATAGSLAAALRPGTRADGRAAAVCVGAAVVWIVVNFLVASAFAHDAVERPVIAPGAAIGALVIALVLGALLAIALWTPITIAMRAAPAGAGHRVWAAARRVSAFGVALIALVAAAPLLVVVLGAIVRAARGQLPRSAWGPVLVATAGSVLALGSSLLGLHWAGVPRHWPNASRHE